MNDANRNIFQVSMHRAIEYNFELTPQCCVADDNFPGFAEDDSDMLQQHRSY